MRPRKREKPGCNGPRTWDVQSTLEHASAAHSTVRAAEWLVAGSPLPQALIQFCQRLTNEPRLCTLIILLRQHLSLNDQFGGGPTDDTCDRGTRWPPVAAAPPLRAGPFPPPPPGARAPATPSASRPRPRRPRIPVSHRNRPSVTPLFVLTHAFVPRNSPIPSPHAGACAMPDPIRSRINAH